MSAAIVRGARREDVPRIWEMLLTFARYERLEHEVTGKPASRDSSGRDRPAPSRKAPIPRSP